MIVKQHKIVYQILFALTIIFILLMGFSFWNSCSTPKAWPFVFLILSLISLAGLFSLNKKISDTESIEDQVKQKVEEERIKILSELTKTKEEEVSIEDDKEEINKLVSKIIPKGNFKDRESFAKKLLSNLSNDLELAQGIFYVADAKKKSFHFLAGYALTSEESVPDFTMGVDLNGQAAQSQELLVVDELPEAYFDIESGLGKSKPKSLLLVPLVDKKKTVGLLELAIFIEIQEKHRKIIAAISKLVAEKLIQIQKS